MKYSDLRDFMNGLERVGELKRVAEPVSARLEMTAVSDSVLRAGGPALWFLTPAGYKISALTNLFGTPKRVALGMGADEVSDLRDVGRLLASLKEPEPPKGLNGGHVFDVQPARGHIGAHQQINLAFFERFQLRVSLQDFLMEC